MNYYLYVSQSLLELYIYIYIYDINVVWFSLDTDRILVWLFVGEYIHRVSFALQGVDISVSLPQETMFLRVHHHWYERWHGSAYEVVLQFGTGWALEIQSSYIWGFKNVRSPKHVLWILHFLIPSLCRSSLIWHGSSSVSPEWHSFIP